MKSFILTYELIYSVSNVAKLNVFHHGTNIACDWHLKPSCEGSFLPLGYSADQSSEKSTPLRGRDRLRRNDPQWSAGFLNYCSWMLPERLRNKSELVGSEETR